MAKQFVNGVCVICGKDHRDVMRNDDIIQQYRWVSECVGHSKNILQTPDYPSEWHAEHGVDPIYRQPKEEVEADILVCKKYLEEHLYYEKEQLQANLAHVSRCEKAFQTGVGYEYLITIGFSKSISIEQLKENIEKLLKANYRYLKHGKFCVEYHGKSENHWHIHVAIKTLLNRRKASIAKQLSNLLGVEQNFVDIKRSYGSPEDYVAGIKTDTKKDQVLKDIELRDLHKIKHLYII